MILKLLPIVFLVSACCTPALRTPFPDATPSLMAEPKPLLLIPEDATASELIGIVNKNYGQYNSLVVTIKLWQEWYRDNKEAFAKDKK